ncbi:biotin-dependent carboxyltransferase family protein [Oceanicoccus sp. KOV_DT_Chl]|uniref:5-oxoprolinase subunit C family protein n=1 Tax=Oceanicoccus sp. KOV_DT_Chl TaxID=1904639 RepID=UPI000C7E1E31|nr:biotin-dependent carboxyltransferase family protein [Oceanicoccus sp. KOV_DT_Chl]
MSANGFTVLKPGVLSLLQDSGRYGSHRLGLTSGGPMDSESFYWANRLCENSPSATAIEISVGGLELVANTNTVVALAGADMPFSINGKQKSLWRTHRVMVGDKLVIGFATQGSRSYFAVAGGFAIVPQFGSTSTVVRENVGGISGAALAANDLLPCQAHSIDYLLRLDESARISFTRTITLRVVLGYQYRYFNHDQQQRFFASSYQLSAGSDRMGYRLQGPKVNIDAEDDGNDAVALLSEGICLGAIQIPADGQPIILLSDRQTIGGYPKLGAVISSDLPRLGQLSPGAKIKFEAVNIEQAQRLFREYDQKLNDVVLQRVG